MTEWLYYSLLVFGIGPNSIEPGGPYKEKDGRWYAEIRYGYASPVGDRLYGDQKNPTHLPLNPQRDWVILLRRSDILAWDDDAGYADLATEVINKLGMEGWELAGIDGWTNPNYSFDTHTCSRYVFKKPQP